MYFMLFKKKKIEERMQNKQLDEIKYLYIDILFYLVKKNKSYGLDI